MLNDSLRRTPISRMTRATVFGVLLFVSAVVAAAQSGFSTLTGAVADETGRGVPGTALILVNEQRRMKYEVTSDELGRFEFVGLPPGSYLIEVRGLGFQVFKDTVTVAGQNLRRNITLKVGSLTETIHVGFSTSDAGAGDQKPPTINEVPARARQACVPSAAGGQIVPPRKLRDVNPQYPAALRGTGTGGIVNMEAHLGVDGYLRDIQIVGDAHPELAQAAIAAVREWRYSETLLNCVPVEVPFTIMTNFREMSPR